MPVRCSLVPVTITAGLMTSESWWRGEWRTETEKCFGGVGVSDHSRAEGGSPRRWFYSLYVVHLYLYTYTCFFTTLPNTLCKRWLFLLCIFYFYCDDDLITLRTLWPLYRNISVRIRLIMAPVIVSWAPIIFRFTDSYRRQALPKLGDWWSEIPYSFLETNFRIENCWFRN